MTSQTSPSTNHTNLDGLSDAYVSALCFELGAEAAGLGARIELTPLSVLFVGPAGEVELDLDATSEPELRARWLGYFELTRAHVQVRVPLTRAHSDYVDEAVAHAERESVPGAKLASVRATLAWAHPHVWEHVVGTLELELDNVEVDYPSFVEGGDVTGTLTEGAVAFACKQRAAGLRRCIKRIQHELARFEARKGSA